MTFLVHSNEGLSVLITASPVDAYVNSRIDWLLRHAWKPEANSAECVRGWVEKWKQQIRLRRDFWHG